MDTKNRAMWIVARHGTVALIVIGALVALGMSGALGVEPGMAIDPNYFHGKLM